MVLKVKIVCLLCSLSSRVIATMISHDDVDTNNVLMRTDLDDQISGFSRFLFLLLKMRFKVSQRSNNVDDS